MLRQLLVVLVLFLSLAGVVHYGNKIRLTWLPESPDTHLALPAASLGQAARQAPRGPPAASAADAPDPPHVVATNSPSENPPGPTTAAAGTALRATTRNTPPASTRTRNTPPASTRTRNTPPASTDIHTPATASAPHTPPTASTTHAAAPVTAATLGPATSPESRSPATTPSAHTPVSSPSTLGHTTGTHPQSSHRTAQPATLSTSPHTSTASEVPVQPIHTAMPTHTAHSATQTAHTAKSTPTAHSTTETVHTARPTPTAHSTTQTAHTARPTPTAHSTTQSTPSTSSAPRPTMAPQPSTVKTGTYEVVNGSRLCIKAEMGLELMVQDLDSVFSPKTYFGIDPNTTQVSGNCGFRKSNLLVNFPGGFVNLTFTKDKNSYYISEVRAYLTISNPEKSYSGLKSSLTVFEAMLGHSFKCVSEQSIQLSRHLQLKMMNTQLQAFDFEGDHFGNVDECSSDYTVMLPVIGAIVLGLCAVGLVVYGIRLRRESSGYQRI